jgi:hypothetical protein
MADWKKSFDIAGGFSWILDNILICKEKYSLKDYAFAINRIDKGISNNSITINPNRISGFDNRFLFIYGQPRLNELLYEIHPRPKRRGNNALRILGMI